jgi:hypothetical protein
VFNFEKLAKDIRMFFLLSLDLVDLVNLSETSKFYHNACAQDVIWKQLFILRFKDDFLGKEKPAKMAIRPVPMRE